MTKYRYNTKNDNRLYFFYNSYFKDNLSENFNKMRYFFKKLHFLLDRKT